jgi:hypothetical protein
VRFDTLPLYVIVTAPGVTSSKANAASYNTWDGHSTIWLGGIQPNGMPGDATIRDYYADNFAHEMAEALTDIGAFGFNGVTVSPVVNGNQICDNEAENYTYRLNGALVQSFWSNTFQGYLVPDGTQQLFQLRGAINQYTLYINGGQEGNINDQITIDTIRTGPYKDGVKVTLNGETVQFDPDEIARIVVTTDTSTDTLTLNSLPGTVRLKVVSRSGASTITVLQSTGGMNYLGVENVPAGMSLAINGGSVAFSPTLRNLSNIKGSVSVNNVILTLYDDFGPAGTTYQIKPGEGDRNGSLFIKGGITAVALSTNSGGTVTLGQNGSSPWTPAVESTRSTWAAPPTPSALTSRRWA